MGLVLPRSGEILYDGKRIDGLPTDRVVDAGVAYAPEGRHLFPDFSVEENLRMGSFPSHARKFHDEEVERVYKTFPILRGRSGQKARTLSCGEAQMVAMGMEL